MRPLNRHFLDKDGEPSAAPRSQREPTRAMTPAAMKADEARSPAANPRKCAMKPPANGPRIAPNPWTALNAPRTPDRSPDGASSETIVDPATLIAAQHRPTRPCTRRISTNIVKGPPGSSGRRRNTGNNTALPADAYSWMRRPPVERIHPPTRPYANAEVTWLATKTAKISGVESLAMSCRKTGKIA